MIKSFRDLDVYKESYELMIELHKALLKFPIIEKHDLIPQIRRATKSIPANIAEGWAKRIHKKEFMKHLLIALGSTNEMEVHLETAKDLTYIKLDLGNNLIKRYQILGAKLNSLIKNWH